MRTSLQALVAGLSAIVWLPLCHVACGAAVHSGWSQIPPSTERIALPSLRGEARFYTAHHLARRGSDRILAIVLDANVVVAPYHFAETGLGAPAPVTGFAEHVAAPLLINAGLFADDNLPLGLARREGHSVNHVRHPSWQGLVVGDGPSRLVDLQHEKDFDTARPTTLVQSMMLVDRDGALRVRDSSLTACRTALAEDTRGHLIVVVTEGALTLGDLGRWLRDGPLHVVQAINLDGGHESQLLLRTPELELTLLGRHGVHFSADVARALPSVLAISLSDPQT